MTDKPSWRSRVTTVSRIAALLLFISGQAVAQGSRPSNEPSDFLRAPPKPASARGHFRLVTLGDLLYSHPFAHRADPELQKVFELIRGGDVTIANREGVFFDLKSFKGQSSWDGFVVG